MLRADGLAVELGDFRLLDATFSVAPGDYFVLLGQSGAGKTIILELLAGIITPSRGIISWQDRDVTHTPVRLRNFGLVYQDHALFPHMSVRRNIGYALPRGSNARVEALAAAVDATALLERTPPSLSQGEAQRVALARALAQDPQVLLLDEPLASLDVQSRARIRALLRRIHRDGRTIIHVTHDYEEAIALATRVAVLEGGRIAQSGTPEDVFHHPRSRFVADFVGARNFFRGRLRRSGTAGLCRLDDPHGTIEISVATDSAEGTGSVVFDSAAVSVAHMKPAGSARNAFHGRLADMEPVAGGVELAVDVGVTLYAKITRESLAEMQLAIGVPLWAGFKATAVRFIPDEG